MPLTTCVAFTKQFPAFVAVRSWPFFVQPLPVTEKLSDPDPEPPRGSQLHRSSDGAFLSLLDTVVDLGMVDPPVQTALGDHGSPGLGGASAPLASSPWPPRQLGTLLGMPSAWLPFSFLRGNARNVRSQPMQGQTRMSQQRRSARFTLLSVRREGGVRRCARRTLRALRHRVA